MTKTEETNGSLFLMALGIIVLLGLIVIFFGIKYVYNPQPPSITYNNFEFRQEDKFWHTLWQRNDKVYTISLRYNPQEVQDVPVFGVLNTTFNTRKNIYVAFDPSVEKTKFKYLAVGGSELGINLAGPLGKQVTAACTVNVSSGCINRPIVSCDDVDKNIIVLDATGDPRITLNGTCMTFAGNDLDLVKSIDKAIYLWLGIIPRPRNPTPSIDTLSTE